MIDYIIITIEDVFGVRELRLGTIIIAMIDLTGREDIVLHALRTIGLG